ncbi:uncharacterized protein JCM6883_006879 [Sporobolomyces salmoneus]|uniref:uncharacterized protein n=1 Tax=Sporobolomyces salmoneus TaxID=183962 RepID=UPI0031766A9C
MLDSSVPETPPQTPLNSPFSNSHFGSSPARSFFPDSPSTTYTTPSPNQLRGSREWDKFQAFDFVEETLKAPNGFVHLDTEYAKEAGIRGVARNFDWRLSSDSYDSSRQVFKRRLGPTEVYLHIGFRAPSRIMGERRILEVWKTILARHTLLSSSIEFSSYYDVHFVNRIPRDEREFEQIARSRLSFKTQATAEDIRNRYLNGERLLSDERLAFLVISTPEETISTGGDEIQEYDFFLYSTHFLGDGMALHSTANEFFTLLASDEGLESESTSPRPDDVDLSLLPPVLESKIQTSDSWSKMAWSAAKPDFRRTEAKNLGGQAFTRASLGPRLTLVPTVSYSPLDSTKILSTCKSHGSTIASALFALSNLAYIRSTPIDKLNQELPTNLYSALNIRGILEKAEKGDWYHLAIGYYNIILPSFYPSSIPVSTYFWHQAASVKKQTSKVVKSSFLKSRTTLMAFEREKRSIGFEKADELKRVEEGIKGLGITADGEDEAELERMRRAAEESVAAKEKERKKQEEAKPKVPNVSLMGLSMLGNLDAIYKHSTYAERGIELHTLTTGSRQRPGALLLFSYTFAGQLFISLGYDSNGFEKGVIEDWWKELLNRVDELLLLKGTEGVEGLVQGVVA